ncbi:glutamyl-Q tRNA(Asp) synthetase [Pseudosulfitobacter pseudonitzschiae]|uniref:Glutamyl-tRNA synthetase n=1 Tax=Pseudosulfitobacter pseudonitzschiae TaxID=1402135 RepID=A0A073IYS2_9RHOB|nr:tRNA glutamyl-Q(34) synthetase GluQRS [Pseudosulfitobacter pseudonitzschiae]KEJ94790.1 glutamyl-tRNA synthetase [Pseudosulfitobacter pseudonitzschiae]QKS08612.1 tRNA glutamyl-Q(34) synthetase GluQRS [Pseudosulfitobacter pseudonitzschiae]SHF80219.1 glutamyl-Q tRNA(Asp) synthetase [Pseudosulfitobacter pseudonitzschiae]
MTFTTRFAPSPTGPLHLGHAYSAMLAHDMAQAQGGRFLLRIEDIDTSRARPAFEAQIYDDLAWLGLTWETPVLRQSDNMSFYRQAIEKLWKSGLIYPCTCNRRDIQAALSAPQEGAILTGPDGPIYPGTCRHVPTPDMPIPDTAALRLNMVRVRPMLDDLRYTETGTDAGMIDFSAEDLTQTLGDIVLARRDMGTSYHLSVVLDDAAQGITHVVRGADLAEATRIHVVLQRLLGLPTPVYHHHRLIRDDAGKRLAKRDDARAIAKYRADGATPGDIRAMVGLPG